MSGGHRFQCPNCGKQLSTDPANVGKHAVCPQCRHRFTVPDDGSLSEEADDLLSSLRRHRRRSVGARLVPWTLGAAVVALFVGIVLLLAGMRGRGSSLGHSFNVIQDVSGSSYLLDGYAEFKENQSLAFAPDAVLVVGVAEGVTLGGTHFDRGDVVVVEGESDRPRFRVASPSDRIVLRQGVTLFDESYASGSFSVPEGGNLLRAPTPVVVAKAEQPPAPHKGAARSEARSPVNEARPRAVPPDGSGSPWTPTGDLEVVAGKAVQLRVLRTGTRVRAVAFSVDGRLLAAGGGDGTVSVWDLRGWRLLHKLAAHGEEDVWAVAFSPDGSCLASGSGIRRGDKSESGEIKLWDIRTGAILRTMRAHSDSVSALAFSPAGSELASASGEEGDPVVLWNPESGGRTRVLKGRQEATTSDLMFAPGGRILIGAGKRPVGPNAIIGHISAWDIRSGELAWARDVGGFLFTAALSPDGSTIACGGVGHCGAVLFINRRTGEMAKTQGEEGDALACIDHVAFSPDGQLVASVFTSGTTGHGPTKLWEPNTYALISELEGHGGEASRVAFSPGGDVLVTGGMDGTLIVWDVRGLKAAAGALPPEASLTVEPAGDDTRAILITAPWGKLPEGSSLQLAFLYPEAEATPQELRIPLDPAEMRGAVQKANDIASRTGVHRAALRLTNPGGGFAGGELRGVDTEVQPWQCRFITNRMTGEGKLLATAVVYFGLEPGEHTRVRYETPADAVGAPLSGEVCVTLLDDRGRPLAIAVVKRGRKIVVPVRIDR